MENREIMNKLRSAVISELKRLDIDYDWGDVFDIIEGLDFYSDVSIKEQVKLMADKFGWF